jgi:hypothetical protein
MEIISFEVLGQVVGSRSQKPLSNLKIEAWDKDIKYNDLLGQTFTNSEGRFSLTFDSTYFREHSPDARPDLLFKVFLGKRLLKSSGDKEIHNAGQKTEVTILVDMPERRAEGKDRITPAKALSIADFLQQSDFKGLYGQFREKAGTSFGFMSDMFMNTVTKFDLTPFKVGDTKNENVVGQDIETASSNLKRQNIDVNEVAEYNPKINSESLSDLSKFPVNLKAGQKVKLFQENGKVRYYSVVKDSGTTTVKSSDQDTLVSKLKAELETTRQDAAEKDQKINALQQEMASLQKDHAEIKTLLKSEEFIKIIQNMKKPK